MFYGYESGTFNHEQAPESKYLNKNKRNLVKYRQNISKSVWKLNKGNKEN